MEHYEAYNGTSYFQCSNEIKKVIIMLLTNKTNKHGPKWIKKSTSIHELMKNCYVNGFHC